MINSQFWRCSLLACSLVASSCGSDSPATPTPVITCTDRAASNFGAAALCTYPPPILQANLVQAGTLSTPGCDALIQLAASVGLATQNCKQFTGLLLNKSNGCAANVRGTTVIFYDAAGLQQASAGGWTYAGTVSPNEQIAYSGGPISIPTRQWYWRTTSSWDDVRCP